MLSPARRDRRRFGAVDGADRHRPRRVTRARSSRSWATTARASRRWSRCSPACTSPTRARSASSGQPVSIPDPSAALALGIATVFQDLALCENLDVVDNLFLGRELSPLRLDEVPWRSGPGSCSASSRHGSPACGADRLAVRRPAPDGGDRPVAARRPEGHHPRRADGRARRRPDGGGARPDRAGARPRARRDHDQPQHGGRPRGRRPGRGAAARAQQRRVRRRRVPPRTGHRHHRGHRQLGVASLAPPSAARPRPRRRTADDAR